MIDSLSLHSSKMRRVVSRPLLQLVEGALVSGGLVGCGAQPTQMADESVSQQSFAVYNQPVVDRTKVQLNGTWKFTSSNMLTGAEVTAYNDSRWSSVSVPHTWNTYQGNWVQTFSNAWYRTHFTIPATDGGKRIFMSFEGVSSVANVYVNGILLGQHRGGYTRFNFDATNAINFGGDNVLAVMVSNAACPDCRPDGTPSFWKGYGGIFAKRGSSRPTNIRSPTRTTVRAACTSRRPA